MSLERPIPQVLCNYISPFYQVLCFCVIQILHTNTRDIILPKLKTDFFDYKFYVNHILNSFFFLRKWWRTVITRRVWTIRRRIKVFGNKLIVNTSFIWLFQFKNSTKFFVIHIDFSKLQNISLYWKPSFHSLSFLFSYCNMSHST